MDASALSLAGTPFDDREFSRLWFIATALYGVGDVVTTIALLGFVPEIEEGNVVLAAIVEWAGTSGLVGLKLVIFFACLGVSLWAARDGDRLLFYAPPALLSVIGGFTTAYNLWLMFGVR